MGQDDRAPEILCPLQGGASILDCEATVRVLQGGVQRAEEKSREILHAVYEREPFDVPASKRHVKNVNATRGRRLEFFERRLLGEIL